ncbi:uncharacterized protein O9250_000087 [Rhynochetos jubatus]
MPTAMKAGLDDKMTDTDNLDGILTEWEKNIKDIKIPACFNKMPQETGKTFLHSKQVGNYLVGEMINKGSFAKVMEGLHIPTGEKVAIKVIDKRKAKQDSYVLKNMKREPRIHQMIKHPNVVQLYETLETDNSYYMVMELCLGGDLLDRICDKKRLAEREVRRYTRQILSAVEHLHRQGIVHRDLKIENFLLDENNNIKIVDFGLSNTAKFEGLSQELLHTQCGSPAYAAPELLAHGKYGPKVDIWSIGVSMFAMLTGTLPFTVEPFNIKQLHQKMLIGEISPIPSDISPGAVHFMQSLLEPDPAKRPGVKEAIKDKWLNEGFTWKMLNAATYENRLCPSELNPVVLNYMTEMMEFSLSEVISILVNNRPSPAMASYCLLLKKLLRYQKDRRRAQHPTQVEEGSDHMHRDPQVLSCQAGLQLGSPSLSWCLGLFLLRGRTHPGVQLFLLHHKTMLICQSSHVQMHVGVRVMVLQQEGVLEPMLIHLLADSVSYKPQRKCYRLSKDGVLRENEIEKHNNDPDKHLNKASEIQISQKDEMDTLENLRNYGNKAFPSVLTLAVPDASQENEIAITLENQENLPEVSKFTGKELVPLRPPKSSNKSTPCEPMCQPLLDFQENRNDFEDFIEARKPCLHETLTSTPVINQPPSSNVQVMTCTSKVPPRSVIENRIITRSPLPHQHTRFKDLLKAADENIYNPAQWHPDKEGTDLLKVDSPQLLPFPRLQQAAQGETLARKVSWQGASQQPTNICPLVLVSGSKPPAFPMSQQQTFTVRSMRQSKENPTHFFNKKTKKNFIQLRHTPKTADLNLPVLPPLYKTRKCLCIESIFSFDSPLQNTFCCTIWFETNGFSSLPPSSSSSTCPQREESKRSLCFSFTNSVKVCLSASSLASTLAAAENRDFQGMRHLAAVRENIKFLQGPFHLPIVSIFKQEINICFGDVMSAERTYKQDSTNQKLTKTKKAAHVHLLSAPAS